MVFDTGYEVRPLRQVTRTALIARETIKVAELRRQEGMDPPIPAQLVSMLDTAESDTRLLTFKYAVLTAAGRKLTGTGSERSVDDDSITEEDLWALADRHVRLYSVGMVERLNGLGECWSDMVRR